MKKTNIDELEFDHSADTITGALLLDDEFKTRTKNSFENIKSCDFDKNSEALEVFLYDLGPKDIQEFTAALFIYSGAQHTGKGSNFDSLQSHLTRLAAEATKATAEASDSVTELKGVINRFCDLIIENS